MATTATRTDQRRPLDFRDFDAVLADLDRLTSRGHDRLGHWDLARTCGHLADWMTYPLDGYPKPPLPVRAILAVLRATVMPGKLRKVLETRTMPRGAPTIPETIPPPGTDEAGAVARLRDTIARFRDHKGPYQPSPMFGDMSREDCRQLQLIHCAHHLSLLKPRDP